MQTQIGNFGRQQEILIEMPGIETSVTQVKSAFDSLFSRLDPAEERIGEPENISISTEIIQLETQRGKEKVGEGKDRTENPGAVGKHQVV